jgi:hypothetical protein
VISVFAIVILSVLGFLFKGNHPELVGGEDDPEDGPAVAATVFTAVIIYAVRCAHPTATPRILPHGGGSDGYEDVADIGYSRASSSSVASRACCTYARTGEARSHYREGVADWGLRNNGV